MSGYGAKAEADISASPQQVWNALTDPSAIEKYMFGAQVETDWKPGSPVTWRGELDGRKFEDHGMVTEVDPEHSMVMTHYSPLSGKPDISANYHHIVYELRHEGDHVHLTVRQDNNETEAAAEESSRNWQTMLDSLKELVEAG